MTDAKGSAFLTDSLQEAAMFRGCLSVSQHPQAMYTSRILEELRCISAIMCTTLFAHNCVINQSITDHELDGKLQEVRL